MSQFWNKRTHSLSPYVPGEQPQDQAYIKLNTNENPYPPSGRVVKAMESALHQGLQLYPDPHCKQLKQAIADYYGCNVSNVFVGNGSDEVLAHIFAGLFDHDQALILPDISYSFYPVYAQLYGQKTQQMALDESFEIDLTRYPTQNGGVIFANPNAPTSITKPLIEIDKFLKLNTQSVVVVDEAYIDFGGDSAIALIDKYPNLLVTQTLSKSRSLAGLRVGFAVGDKSLIEGLERVKNSFNSYPLDKVALAGSVAAIEDEAAFEQSTAKIIKTREWAAKQLTSLGFEVLPSGANFLLAKPQFMGAEQLYFGLKERGILVRYFSQDRINEYVRITVGTDEEMRTLMDQLEQMASPLS
ncbi:MAG: histidinol-phosphate aminotransferase [Saprospiraceae bacterium]|jgi:histidinol-phosphate aminotransferase